MTFISAFSNLKPILKTRMKIRYDLALSKPPNTYEFGGSYNENLILDD